MAVKSFITLATVLVVLKINKKIRGSVSSFGWDGSP
jgi:hypothetical protein